MNPVFCVNAFFVFVSGAKKSLEQFDLPSKILDHCIQVYITVVNLPMKGVQVASLKELVSCSEVGDKALQVRSEFIKSLFQHCTRLHAEGRDVAKPIEEIACVLNDLVNAHLEADRSLNEHVKLKGAPRKNVSLPFDLTNDVRSGNSLLTVRLLTTNSAFCLGKYKRYERVHRLDALYIF